MSAGLVFDKYELRQRLAVGGMGEIFFGMQKGVFERPVVLKALLAGLAQEESFVSQFLDEARLVARLNHPNIISIYEVGRWHGTYFLVMEYVRGLDLATLRTAAADDGVALSATVAARIIREAGAGLNHAHVAADEHGAPLTIVHRDVTPRNIMVREDGLVKVLDFGIARGAHRTSQKTATGTVKGTTGYLAPEQVLGQSTALSDQFSLGIVFWELLSGRRLFKAASDVAVLNLFSEAPILSPSSAERPCPAELETIVMRMLERDPAKRFESCERVVEALDAALRGLGSDQNELSKVMAAIDVDGFVNRVASNARALVSPVPVRSPGTAVHPFKADEVTEAPTTVPISLSDLTGSAKPTLFTAGRVAAVLLLVSVLAVTVVSAGHRKPPTVTPLPAPPPPPPPLVIAAPAPVVVKAVVPDVAAPMPAPVVVPVVKSTPAAPKPSGVGYLTIDTKPWTKVSIDGQLYGLVPLNRKKLPAGQHTLELVNEGAHIFSTQKVEIVADQTTKLQLTLRPQE